VLRRQLAPPTRQLAQQASIVVVAPLIGVQTGARQRGRRGEPEEQARA